MRLSTYKLHCMLLYMYLSKTKIKLQRNKLRRILYYIRFHLLDKENRATLRRNGIKILFIRLEVHDYRQI